MTEITHNGKPLSEILERHRRWLAARVAQLLNENAHVFFESAREQADD